MKYEQEILQILAKAGSTGLSVKIIARHVFNVSNSFFEVLDIKDVHTSVQQYLARNSKDKNALIERVGPKGIYRLNTRVAKSQQMMFQFLSEEEYDKEKEKEKSPDDQSLSLFDDLL